MPGGEARAARGGEPAGLRPQEAEAARLPPTRPARQQLGARAPVHAWQGRCALWYAYAYHGREMRIGIVVALSKRHRLHVAVPKGDRPTCKDLTAGWPQKEMS
jgi:hypothetical protein